MTLALLLTLALLRFTGPTIAAAAVCVPILYLLYLWEVEVYEDEPLLVISATFVLGLLLGVPWARLTGPIVTNTLMQDVTLGSAPGLDFVVGIIFPLIAQALMLVGPMILLYTQKFDEALDGYAFGVASALGFSLSTTVVNLWPQLQNGFVSSIPISENIIVVLERGLIIPFLYASTTGLIAGALWLRRGRVRSILVHGWTTTAEIAVVIPVIVWCVLGLINIFVLTPVRVLITYLVAAIIMALWVRVALHHMLLAEAVEVEVGSLQQCFNCYRVVPRMAFCPHCGIATRATPKTGHGRHRRRYR